MRVALIADEAQDTGIGKYAHNLAIELPRYGVEADLYFVKWTSHELSAPIESSLLVRPSPLPIPITSLEAIVAHWRRNSLFPQGYDLYHATQQFLISVLPSAGRRVATVHDLKPLVLPDEYPFLLKRVLGRFLKSAAELDMVIADSQNTRADLVSRVEIPSEKLVTIPPGHGNAFRPQGRMRTKLGIPEEATVVLNVGTEDNSKNMPFLLQVVAKLARKVKDLRLVRIGKKKDSTDRTIRALGIGDRITYLSNLSEEQLAAYYSSADLLLHPALYEGFGLPLVEAMASGCPVVSSDRSSLPEVLAGAGLIVPLEVDLWVSEVSRLLSDPSKREGYRRLGLERAKAFTWSNCAERTAMAYREALS